MFHLEVLKRCLNFFCLSSSSISDTIRPTMRDQQLAPPHKIGSAAELSLRLAGSRVRHFSSPLSQNAAAILVDLGHVDVR
jgi:hypothetical protein